MFVQNAENAACDAVVMASIVSAKPEDWCYNDHLTYWRVTTFEAIRALNNFKQELHYGATHVFFYKRRFYSNIFMSSADRKPAEDLELSDRLWSLTASGSTPPGVCKHSRQNHCPEQMVETLCELECFGSWSKRSVYEQCSSVKTAMTSLNDSLTSNFGT